MWYANNREFPKPDPARIEVDRKEWRKRDDSVLRFVEETLEFDAESHVMSSELFQEFGRWLALQNQRAWGDRVFFERFGNHELIAMHNVYRKKVKKGLGLSRPAGGSMTVVPKSYQAWLALP